MFPFIGGILNSVFSMYPFTHRILYTGRFRKTTIGGISGTLKRTMKKYAQIKMYAKKKKKIIHRVLTHCMRVCVFIFLQLIDSNNN